MPAGVGIVSWCAADVTGDNRRELIMITGGGIEDGLRYGDRLMIFSGDSQLVLDINLSVLKPLKVQAGDINGDGRREIALCVYKTARFHPVMAKRPFFYDYADVGLEPVWLGSRLSRPFDDFILADVNSDGIDEIIAIELLQNGDRTVCAYYWKGFGFELLAESLPLSGELSFIGGGKDVITLSQRDGTAKAEYNVRLNDEMTGFILDGGR